MPEPTKSYSQWCGRLRGPTLFIVAGLATAAVPGSAAATSIYMDEFSVTRNGSPLFDDTFNQNTTLSGGTGSTVGSGVNFAGDCPATYFVHGTIPETTANSGQALLNTANGIVVTQPDPVFPVISRSTPFSKPVQPRPRRTR